MVDFLLQYGLWGLFLLRQSASVHVHKLERFLLLVELRQLRFVAAAVLALVLELARARHHLRVTEHHQRPQAIARVKRVDAVPPALIRAVLRAALAPNSHVVTFRELGRLQVRPRPNLISAGRHFFA